jgi:amino acid adenylation domain-containing protein
MGYLIHHLLIESAQRYPDHEAVRFQEQSITYNQLDGITNQLANALLRVGVERGDRVGIYLNKSLGSLIAVFGILKVGGVYVPLDPNAPVSRLAYITRNCEIRVLVTSNGKSETLGDFISEDSAVDTLVFLDDLQEEHAFPERVQIITREYINNQDASRSPIVDTIDNDLAYILYTSGSTGDPKGVMISHRTIFTFINWCSDTFKVTPDDRVTSHAPLHFDLSTFDIFVTIKAGGTVVIIPEMLSIFPPKLAKFLQDERITITYLVPSVLSLLVNYGNLAELDFLSMRLILFAGEVFPIKYLRELASKIPHVEYYNLYGPTETNVCTYYKVQPADLEAERTQPVPIGRACENVEVFAIDDQGRLINESGIEGELWVRGSCVAQGYWGDREKTCRNFVSNDYQAHFSEIAYRTGDIVTLDEDRINWIYIGRRDLMVKSRGYRIELGDIEAALYSHSGVKEAAVIALPDELIGNRIKAFIVPFGEDHLLESELEAHTSKRLPKYMIPESFIICSTLPKTSSGKVDRTRLAQMELSS